MFINWSMDEQNVVYPYDGIIFDHKKEQSTGMCSNIAEPWKQ